MYDMHYDLLTILYYNLTKNNKYQNINKLIDDCKKIYNNNITGGIINLYFMSKKEMLDELDIKEEELQDVVKMFKKSIEYLDIFKEKNIIQKNIDFIYSIEGCDFLKDEKELEKLYQLGLRSILPVWNNKNKFGSGIRTNEGITKEGIKLIKKAIELGIIIDISHANEQTFYDIINITKEEKEKGKNPILMASHSNVKTLCNRKRNLDDLQLEKLKEEDGYIGLFTNGNFLSLNNKNFNYQKRQEEYLKHLKYIIEKIGFSQDKILISTDDMNFHPDSSYHNIEAFPIETIKKDLYSIITKEYDRKTAKKIMKDNPQRLINKIKTLKQQ